MSGKPTGHGIRNIRVCNERWWHTQSLTWCISGTPTEPHVQTLLYVLICTINVHGS